MRFNLYFAGWGSRDADEYLRSKKAHRLLSQANESRVIKWWVDDKLADKLFIDSGAFTVAHSDADINLDTYISFINSYPEINNWAELDTIPYPVLNTRTAKDSSEASWNNFVYMKDKVDHECNIIPVYHFGEPLSALTRILDTKLNGKLTNYIGVGGRHGVSTDEQIKYFNEVFRVIKSSSNPDVKVHAFGITVPRILERFPFYSADSTTWLQTAINGMILLRDLSTVYISDGTKKEKYNIQNIDKSIIPVIHNDIDYFGYNFDELCRDYKLRLRYNIDVLLDWEANYTYKGPKTFKSTRLF